MREQFLKKLKSRPRKYLIAWIVIGIGIGVALENIAVGVALGIGVGLALEARGKRKLDHPEDGSEKEQ